MLAILNFLNAHNLPIFQPILVILISKFMVHRALSDKAYLLLGLLSPLNDFFLCRQFQVYFITMIRHTFSRELILQTCASCLPDFYETLQEWSLTGLVVHT